MFASNYFADVLCVYLTYLVFVSSPRKAFGFKICCGLPQQFCCFEFVFLCVCVCFVVLCFCFAYFRSCYEFHEEGYCLILF